MGTSLRGRCLCGAIRIQLIGEPLSCAHCHCRWCRLAHGAAFVTWLGVAEENLVIEAGAECVSWFSASTGARRGFCRVCGATLFYAAEVCLGEVHVARACVEDPSAPTPAAHAFSDQQVPWVELVDLLPRITGDHEVLRRYHELDRTVPE
ncbi:MAG: GFA family protein [Armatimonadetes bacterium]|nr:GFA family protein [Armatimonadota bacterium]